MIIVYKVILGFGVVFKMCVYDRVIAWISV